MSLEVIEKVTRSEAQAQERKAAAEAEAKQIVANAQRDGRVLLEKVRSDAAESGRNLLKQAEQTAAEQTAQIAKDAEAESKALQAAAQAHLEEAAEFIVGRVVKH